MHYNMNSMFGTINYQQGGDIEQFWQVLIKYLFYYFSIRFKVTYQYKYV